MHATSPSAAEGSPRIIVVEDDGPCLQAVSDFLSHSGFDVLRARSVSDARATLMETPCHAMVLDLHLPDRPGTDLVRQVREHPDPHVSHIVIALLTASSMESDRETCLRAGADIFLTKPVRLRDIARLLHGYIRSRFT
jgi:DNA-binding response OmpR family regulator